jgi:serine/threonine protein kinase
VTELCEGGDMLQLLNANRLTPEIVREVMTQLFSAIKYIHSFNILHRDLKLENMVIVKKLKKDKLDKINVKLIDFGISLDLNKAPSNKTN